MTRAAPARRALAAGSLAAMALVSAPSGCGDHDATDAPVVRIAEPTTEPAWNPVVRRPPWTFVFEKTGARCTIFRIDAGERKTRIDEAACPVDMEVGERLRLAGKTCLREGGAPGRDVPVTCPDPLTNAEEEFLETKRKRGELGP